ncbi:unnamed protein product [Agarophyton chilense]
MLAALRVNRQWRQVATQLLRDTHTLDVSTLYCGVHNARDTPPTASQLQATLRNFPTIRALHIRKWPFDDTMPHVLRTSMCAVPRALRVLHLEAVPLSHHAVLTVLSSFTQLEHLLLLRCDDADDELLCAMASAKARRPVLPALVKMVVSRASRLLGVGVAALIAVRFAPIIKVTHCPALRAIERPTRILRVLSATVHPEQSFAALQSVALSSNVRLAHVNLQFACVRDLNLSQCTSLSNLSVCINAVENLNLSGCNVLHALTLHALTLHAEHTHLADNHLAEHAPVPPTSAAPPPALVSSLKTVNVYGARRIQPNVLRSLYAAQHMCYSNLSRIDLNGCTITHLVLDNHKYPNVHCNVCAARADVCRSLTSSSCCRRRAWWRV